MKLANQLMDAIEEQGLLVLEPRDTFDRAIIGITTTPDDHWPRQTDTACVVYSPSACIDALMSADQCDYDEAWEFLVQHDEHLDGRGHADFLRRERGRRKIAVNHLSLLRLWGARAIKPT